MPKRRADSDVKLPEAEKKSRVRIAAADDSIMMFSSQDVGKLQRILLSLGRLTEDCLFSFEERHVTLSEFKTIFYMWVQLNLNHWGHYRCDVPFSLCGSVKKWGQSLAADKGDQLLMYLPPLTGEAEEVSHFLMRFQSGNAKHCWQRKVEGKSHDWALKKEQPNLDMKSCFTVLIAPELLQTALQKLSKDWASENKLCLDWSNQSLKVYVDSEEFHSLCEGEVKRNTQSSVENIIMQYYANVVSDFMKVFTLHKERMIEISVDADGRLRWQQTGPDITLKLFLSPLVVE